MKHVNIQGKNQLKYKIWKKYKVIRKQLRKKGRSLRLKRKMFNKNKKELEFNAFVKCHRKPKMKKIKN